jgi:hypothetical protein
MNIQSILDDEWLFSIGTLYLCVMGFALGFIIGYLI